jgi:hypothetical protein
MPDNAPARHAKSRMFVSLAMRLVARGGTSPPGRSPAGQHCRFKSSTSCPAGDRDFNRYFGQTSSQGASGRAAASTIAGKAVNCAPGWDRWDTIARWAAGGWSRPVEAGRVGRRGAGRCARRGSGRAPRAGRGVWRWDRGGGRRRRVRRAAGVPAAAGRGRVARPSRCGSARVWACRGRCGGRRGDGMAGWVNAADGVGAEKARY